MSLFKLKEWWSTKLGCEQFSEGGLAVGNIHIAGGNEPKIVTGSLQGRLRVHDPQFSTDDARTLLLDSQLNAPIIQLKIGNLVPQVAPNPALAVLHPCDLVVYTCIGHASTSIGKCNSDTCHLELIINYAHRVCVSGAGSHAFSMCLGPFGGALNHDLILLQCVDGRINAYEYDAEVFSRFLEDCLAPGPLEYISCIDSFITSTPSLCVKCYKYQVLATACDHHEVNGESGSGITARRFVTSDWTCDVGEMVISLAVTQVASSSVCDIIALGEHSIFVLSTRGAIKATKLLDFGPTCLFLHTRYKSCAAVQQDCADYEIHHGNSKESTSACADGNLIICASDTRVVFFWAASLKTAWVAHNTHGDKSLPLAISVLHADRRTSGILVVQNQCCSIFAIYFNYYIAPG